MKSAQDGLKGNVLLVILLLGVVVFGLFAVYLLLTPNKQSQLGAPKSDASCSSNDASFCDFVNKVKVAVAARDMGKLVDMQVPQDYTCDSKAAYQFDICKGIADGVKVSAYQIGYSGSEGTLYTKEQLNKNLADFYASEGPFVFFDSTLLADGGRVTFLNALKTSIFETYAKKASGEWKIDYQLIGISMLETVLEGKTIAEVKKLFGEPSNSVKNDVTHKEVLVYEGGKGDSSFNYIYFVNGKFEKSVVDEYNGVLDPSLVN